MRSADGTGRGLDQRYLIEMVWEVGGGKAGYNNTFFIENEMEPCSVLDCYEELILKVPLNINKAKSSKYHTKDMC